MIKEIWIEIKIYESNIIYNINTIEVDFLNFFGGQIGGHPQVNGLDGLEVIKHGIISSIERSDIDVLQPFEDITNFIESIFLDHTSAVKNGGSLQVIEWKFLDLGELCAQLLNRSGINAGGAKGEAANLEEKSKTLVEEAADLSVGKVEVREVLVFDKLLED